MVVGFWLYGIDLFPYSFLFSSPFAVNRRFTDDAIPHLVPTGKSANSC